MPPLNMADMVNMILLNDLVPVFVDIGRKTGNIDPSALASRITPRSRVLLVTHLSGIPTNMAPIVAIAREHGLMLFEDASQSIGARYQGINVGLLGDAGFFSISTLKPVSTFCGGMVLTNNEELAASLRRAAYLQCAGAPASLAWMALRDLSLKVLLSRTVFSLMTYYMVGLVNRRDGDFLDRLQRGNQNMTSRGDRFVHRLGALPEEFDVAYSDLQARLGICALRTFDQQTRRRADLGIALYRRLEQLGFEGLPTLPDGSYSIFWRFPVWVDDPRSFRQFLFDRRIDTTTCGLVCCSRELAFGEYSHDTPEAYRFMDNMVFLPIYPEMQEPDLEAIAEAVAEYMAPGQAGPR